MTTSKLFFLPVILLSAVTLVACSTTSPTALTSTPSPVSAVAGAEEQVMTGKKQANYEFTASESGVIALDLLDAETEIVTEDFGNAGKYVTSINGLAGNKDYYWAFYVNNEYAEQGAGQTKLDKGDTIKFVYEAVTASK